jgi:hypothetical protein
MTNSDPTATTKQAMPFDSLLAQSRDLVCERLAQALAGMLDKADDTISVLINETQDQDVRKLYLEARDKALAQRKTIEEQFHAHYLREFQARSNRMNKIGQSFAEFDSSSVELDLVGVDDLNETLKLNDMATKLRRYCDEELVALDQRVGVLLGDASLEAKDNPFSPQAIFDAFKHTCRQVDSNVKVRMVLLKLFDDHVLDDIRSIYKAVNALLVQNSILPTIRYRVARGQEGSKVPLPGAPAGEEPPGAVAHAADRVAGGEHDYFSVLQNLLASNFRAMPQPGAAGGAAGASTQGVTAMPGFPYMPGIPGSGGAERGAGAAGGAGASAQSVTAMPGFPYMPGIPGSGGAERGADGVRLAVIQGAELMDFLTRIQRGDVKAMADGGLPLAASAGEPGTANVLRELKATKLGTGMNQMDVITLDIVAMLFDQLFDDPKIPIAVKGLIGRMQIPMLKVAIADKALFSEKSHPARRLLDTLGELSLRLPADFNASNPLFGRLEAIIQELINSFQDSMEIFDVVRERLQNLTVEDDQRVEQNTRSAAKRIEQKENLAVSKTMAQNEVKARIRAGELPRPVLAFLVQQWVKFLLMVHAKRGHLSNAWKNSLATMDLLIWSVQAKHTSEERRKLATELPVLLKRLAAGLRMAGVEDAIRARFFADLMKIHMRALGEGGEGKFAAAHDAGAENNPAKPDAAPAEKPVPAPKEAVQPIPATAGKPLAPAEKPVPASKETVQPIPATAGKPLAPAEKPVPALKETVQPIPATAGKPLAPAEAPEAVSDSLDFTASLTIKNPFGSGEVQVEEIELTDVRAAGTARAIGDAHNAELIKNFKEGTWVEFREKGEEDTHRPAKLSYISPLKSSFLFVDRLGKTVKECSRAELARLVRLGAVVVMDEVPLFDRVMNGLIGKLR